MEHLPDIRLGLWAEPEPDRHLLPCARRGQVRKGYLFIPSSGKPSQVQNCQPAPEA
jgi:hypothetical protein